LKRLFLFDIDGTLMRRTGPYHEQALVEAVRRVMDLEAVMDGIPVHGMLDQDILTEMLQRLDVSEPRIGEALPELIRVAQEIYPETCPDLSAKVLPGVREVLAEIAAAKYPTGLVTGNLTRIGWTKVERAGIGSYFGFGAFAEMARTRGELAKMACGLAGARPETEVTMIGDAPSDVRAAKENGFRMVAVATGLTSAEELRDLGADVVLNDLSRDLDRKRVWAD
jgi:phosphoglycolate phosphatase